MCLPTNLDVARTSNASAKSMVLKFFSSCFNIVPDRVSMEGIIHIFRTMTAISPCLLPPDTQGRMGEVIAFHFWAFLRGTLYSLKHHPDTLPSTAEGLVERCEHI